MLNYAEGPSAGPPLLLLHGLAARWQVFGPLVPPLAAEWHLFALDFRGHGQSARAPGRYRIADFSDDAVRLLRQRVTEPAVLYGHSLGGWVALQVAAELPDAVRAIVVGDSAIYPGDIDPDFAVSYLADLPIALRSLATSLNSLDPQVLADLRAGRVTDGYDPERLLPRVRCPALLLQASPALGGLMTDADVVRALALLPDGRHVRFDELGHGLHVQDAAAVLDVVRGFLAGV